MSQQYMSYSSRIQQKYSPCLWLMYVDVFFSVFHEHMKVKWFETDWLLGQIVLSNFFRLLFSFLQSQDMKEMQTILKFSSITDADTSVPQ